MPEKTGGGPFDFGTRSDVSKCISVQGDALIATEVNIENYNTRVAGSAMLDTLTDLQAAQIGARASALSSAEEPLEDILKWLAEKFGVPGYLSIPAAGYDNAMNYLESKSSGQLRKIVHQRDHR